MTAQRLHEYSGWLLQGGSWGNGGIWGCRAWQQPAQESLEMDHHPKQLWPLKEGPSTVRVGGRSLGQLGGS